MDMSGGRRRSWDFNTWTRSSSSCPIYAVAMAVICYALAFFFKSANARICNQSTILFADAKASMTDGTLSAGIAVGVFFLARASADPGPTAWIPYLADSVFTLVLSAILIREPFIIIKTSVIELAGGTLQDPHAARAFREAVAQAARGAFDVAGLYMSKTGSLYMLVVYLRADGAIRAESLLPVRRQIEDRLTPDYPHLHLELILQPDPA
jgi:divalent metal cation (Fe/Co/Zn/Cd) transporter